MASLDREIELTLCEAVKDDNEGALWVLIDHILEHRPDRKPRVEKKFCENCKHYKVMIGYLASNGFINCCYHPLVIVDQTNYGTGLVKIVPKNCEELNKDGLCQMFEESESTKLKNRSGAKKTTVTVVGNTEDGLKVNLE